MPGRPHHFALATLLAALVTACAPTTTTTSPGTLTPERTAPGSPPSSTRTPPPRTGAPATVSREPWTFRGREGEIIRTTHYRIFTTVPNSILKDRLTLLIEEAMHRYRTAITDLPAPPIRLDTYFMENRPQWEQVTRMILGQQADAISRIERGGFATRGIAVYFNIGLADTMTIAAHEGWHQYTQRTFRNKLPIWLEEGMALYHEGHRWEGSRPVFLPWANPERYDRLRASVTAGRFIPLTTLITMTPNDHLEGNTPTVLDFYAHAWAAAHFLVESPDLRPALEQILQDAAAGRLRTSRTGHPQSRGFHGDNRSAQRPADPVLIYTGMDPQALDERYEAFVREIVRPGGRDRIISGRSPLNAQP